MSGEKTLRQKLAELEIEHRDLDDVITRLTESAPFDRLQLQRLKKRKLEAQYLIFHLKII